MSKNTKPRIGIKPCPRCKGRGRLDFEVIGDGNTPFKGGLSLVYFVVCMECGYKGPQTHERYKAVSAWNDIVYNKNLVERKIEEVIHVQTT